MDKRYQIGEWVLNPSLHSLEQATEKLILRAKLVDLLVCFAENPGRVLQRDEIFEQVWGKVRVTEDSLTRGVSELRKILGDDPEAPTYIETIRKGGYRLIASVRPLLNGEASGSAPRIRSPRTLTLVAGIGVVLLACLLYWVEDSVPSEPDWSTTDLQQPRPLSSMPGRETDPAVSPDGERVAFSWGGAKDDQYDIYVKNLADDSLLRLTHDAGKDVHPAWSPDGKQVAFLRAATEGSVICTVAAEGGPSIELCATDGWASGLDWSADGRFLASAVVTPGEVLRIVRFAIDTQRSLELTAPQDLYSDHSPAFSPSGHQLAFVRTQHSSNHAHIGLVDLEGDGLRMLAETPGTIKGIDWAGDGDRLLVAVEADFGSRIYTLSVQDGRMQAVPLLEESATYPSLSADGRTLVYEDSTPTQDLWRASLDDSLGPDQTELILHTNQREREAYFSPDGEQLAFISDRSGTLELWLAGSSGEAPRRITHTGNDRLSSPRWSPDGERIAFQRSSRNGSSIWIIPAAGGEAERLDLRPAPAALCGWSAATNSIYFAAEQEGSWRVWRTHIEDGSIECVTEDGVAMLRVSPDGNWFYYSRVDQPGIWRRPIAGGQAELLTDDHPARFRGNWALAEDRLLFTRWTGSKTELCSIDLVDGMLRTHCELPFQLHAPSFSLSPRNDVVVLATTSEGSGDLKLVEGFVGLVER